MLRLLIEGMSDRSLASKPSSENSEDGSSVDDVGEPGIQSSSSDLSVGTEVLPRRRRFAVLRTLCMILLVIFIVKYYSDKFVIVKVVMSMKVWQLGREEKPCEKAKLRMHY